MQLKKLLQQPSKSMLASLNVTWKLDFNKVSFFFSPQHLPIKHIKEVKHTKSTEIHFHPHLDVLCAWCQFVSAAEKPSQAIIQPHVKSAFGYFPNTKNYAKKYLRNQLVVELGCVYNHVSTKIGEPPLSHKT